ncbi:MAG: hypothetical protein JEZ07_14215 [Phycisphaerae bacterium]|nr:hypothetical protein [Phycisphaerae bacterium]
MAKVSIWQRFGGWLKHSGNPEVDGEVVNLDPEALLIGPGNDDDMDDVWENSRQNQLAVVEDHFSRLVEAIERMDDNFAKHRKQSAEVHERIGRVADVLETMPEEAEKNRKILSEISDELKNQTVCHKQLSEIIETLPESSAQQAQQLSQIATKLESSLSSQAKQLELYDRFDQSVQAMLDHSKAQSVSVANIGQMLEDSENRLQRLMVSQNKRFNWMLGGIFTVAAALVGLIIWNITH